MTWPGWPTRSRPAGPAPGWCDGGRRWRPSGGRPIEMSSTGAARCPVSAIPRRPSLSSAWPRRPMAPTAPAACLPGIDPVTGCSPRCIGAGWPTRRVATPDDGLQLRHTWVTAAVRCAPPANRPRPGRAGPLRPLLNERTGRPAQRPGHRGPRAVRLRRGGAGAGPTTQSRGSGTAPRPRRRWAGDRAPTTPASKTPLPARLTEPMIDAVFGRAVEAGGRRDLRRCPSCPRWRATVPWPRVALQRRIVAVDATRRLVSQAGPGCGARPPGLIVGRRLVGARRRGKLMLLDRSGSGRRAVRPELVVGDSTSE